MKITLTIIHNKPTKKSIGRFFRKHQDYLKSLFILTIADIRASGIHVESDIEKVNEFYEKLQELKMNIRILKNDKFKLNYSGNDIMRLFNITPSPLVGKIKKTLEKKVCAEELDNDWNIINNYLRNNKKSFV